MAAISCLAIAFCVLFFQAKGKNAVLRASTSSHAENFCVVYDPKWKELPTELSVTPGYKFLALDAATLCGPVNASQVTYTGTVIFSKENRRSCSFSKRHQYAQEKNATGLVIVNSKDKWFIAIASNSQDYVGSTIPLAVMRKSDYDSFERLGKSAVVQLYVPPLAAVDSNLFIIWILAVGSVVIGAYWSGMTAKEQREKLAENRSTNNDQSSQSGDDENGSMSVSPLMIVVFVVMICGFLLLVYYFYSYVIYAIIGMFALASFCGMFECLNALVTSLPFCTCLVPPNRLPVLKHEPFVKSVVVFLFSLAFTVWWVVVRNDSYAWVLQDILGVLFCISLLRNMRLPNMKICTLLLILLLVYDVFFVFITPLFSAGHHSVMVDVATGEGHKEQIPMVIKVPRVVRSAMLVCQKDYSLLGFGDILVPGLFVSFCNCYDQMAKTPYRIYYIASSVAYGCGLFITFVALLLMKEGQPALVYLVPCTLGIVFVISLKRKEFCLLWRGTYRTNTLKQSDQPLSDEDDCLYDRNEEGGSTVIENNESPIGERDRLIN